MNSLSVATFTQLSMDGSTDNWVVLCNLVENQKIDKLPPAQDMGCWSLRIVSGGFESGIKATKWGLNKISKVAW